MSYKFISRRRIGLFSVLGALLGVALHFRDWLWPHADRFLSDAVDVAVHSTLFSRISDEHQMSQIMALNDLVFIVPAILINGGHFRSEFSEGGLYILLRYPRRRAWFLRIFQSVFVNIGLYVTSYLGVITILLMIRYHLNVEAKALLNIFLLLLMMTFVFGSFSLIVNILSLRISSVYSILITLSLLFLCFMVRVHAIIYWDPQFVWAQAERVLNPLTFMEEDCHYFIQGIKALLFLGVVAISSIYVVERMDLSIQDNEYGG